MTTIPIREWEYPDTLDKMIMNGIVTKGFMDSRDIHTKAPDPEVEAGIIDILNDFIVEGYVTSGVKLDTVTGLNYTVYTSTAFFKLMIQEQRARVAAEDKAKIDLWNAQQAELPENERFDNLPS